MQNVAEKILFNEFWAKAKIKVLILHKIDIDTLK